MEDPTMNGEVMPDSNLMDTNIEGNMDANMDANMDDLFGEAADGLVSDALGVPLPSAPIPPELALRIADMQGRGCCTKLAWSSTGSIAQIKENGRKIVFRILIRNPQTGDWPLTEESKYPIIAGDGATWEHIQFSNLGTDLAAVDSLGHVYVYTLTGPLGRMPLAPHNITRSEPPKSDSDAVVGLHWLPVYSTEFKFPYITPATKTEDKWKAFMHHRDTNEPSVHHAVDGRSAFLYVSREAKLTLMYQIEAVWHAVDTQLENLDSTEQLLSHAAMGEEGDTLLLITHDVSKRFRLYRITIAWNPTQHPRPNHPQPAMVVAPMLQIGRLTVLDHVTAQHADAARLSQLHIVPVITSHGSDPNTPTYPTVLAIFTRASVSADLTQQHQDTFSIISRWHVESAVPALHEAFTKLKTSGPTSTPQIAVTSLRRQEDILTNRLVLSVKSQYFNTMLAFAASDGTAEFRERITMASIEPYPDATAVTSLPQSGFEHLIDEHYIHVAMSGDGSALFTIRSDGTLGHKMMSLRYTWHPVMDDSGLIEAAVVCLARQYAILACTSVSNDETLILLPLDLSKDMRSRFIKEVINILGRVPFLDLSMHDVNRQQGMVIREPLISKALSAQVVLGYKPGTTQLTFMGKFAFAFLNMRLVATTVAPLMTVKPELLLKSDFLTPLRGLIRWGSDMLVYILAALVTVRRQLDAAPGSSVKELFEDFISEKDSPIIHLMLSTSSRAIVRFLSSSIPKYLQCVTRVTGSARSVAERQQLTEISEMGTSLPFEYSEFESFIVELDTAVRNAYTQGDVRPDRRSEIELCLICCDQPLPNELQPALQVLLETALPKFMEKVDMGKLYFWDTSWLGIEPPPAANQLQYDVIRKVPITKDMKLRICRRCGGMMEDMSPEKIREMAQMLAHVARHCVCANYWVVD